MTKDQIIKRLMLELETAIQQFQAFDENNDLTAPQNFINELNEAGYKSYPRYIRQTEEQRKEIKELLEMKP